MSQNISLLVGPEDCDARIDAYLAGELTEFTRSYLQKIIKAGGVTVNGKSVKANYRLDENDDIRLTVPDNQELDIEAEDIPLDILYEDEELLVINKPKGMVVHPAAGHYSGTLVNALLWHCRGNLSGINGVLRPGIVHRIDRDTTGALVVCKTDRAHKSLADQLAVHSITRRYRAICVGYLPEDEMTITGNIGRSQNDRKKMAVVSDDKGKSAVTHVKVLERLNGYSYIECQLETGRTHQIRVHLSHIGHPLLGDTVYGARKSPFKNLEGQCLHAMILGFQHPTTNAYMEFEAPLPAYFEKLLRTLK